MSQKHRKYSLTIILDTRGYEAPVSTIEEKITETLKEFSGVVESLENLGRRDFSRITEKGHTGDTYLYIVVSGPASLPADFQESVRLDNLYKRTLFKSL